MSGAAGIAIPRFSPVRVSGFVAEVDPDPGAAARRDLLLAADDLDFSATEADLDVAASSISADRFLLALWPCGFDGLDELFGLVELAYAVACGIDWTAMSSSIGAMYGA